MMDFGRDWKKGGRENAEEGGGGGMESDPCGKRDGLDETHPMRGQHQSNRSLCVS